VGGAISRDPTGANDGIGDDAKASIAPTNAPDGRGEDDSGTIPENTRRVLIEALARAVRDGAVTGDAALLKIAARALVELSGSTHVGDRVAEVIDFIKDRSRT
jgi:hypothetical protein